MKKAKFKSHFSIKSAFVFFRRVDTFFCKQTVSKPFTHPPVGRFGL